MINSVYPLTIAASPIGDDRAGSWPGAGVARAFARAVESGRLNLPLPGGGRTRKRWAVLAQLGAVLAQLGEEDLSLARLAEGHADALAILAELGAVTTPPPGSRWGVWAAPAGRGEWATRWSRPRLSATSARTPWHISVPSTSPCTPRRRHSKRPPPRSTRIRTTERTAAGGVLSGCAH